MPPFENDKVLGAWRGRSTLAMIIYKLKCAAHSQPAACAVYKGKGSSAVAFGWKGCVSSHSGGFLGGAESFEACSGPPSSLHRVGHWFI